MRDGMWSSGRGRVTFCQAAPPTLGPLPPPPPHFQPIPFFPYCPLHNSFLTPPLLLFYPLPLWLSLVHSKSLTFLCYFAMCLLMNVYKYQHISDVFHQSMKAGTQPQRCREVIYCPVDMIKGRKKQPTAFHSHTCHLLALSTSCAPARDLIALTPYCYSFAASSWTPSQLSSKHPKGNQK